MNIYSMDDPHKERVTIFLAYKWKLWIKMVLIVLNIMELMILLFVLKDRAALYSVTAFQMNVLFYFNFFGLLISFFATFFYFNWSAEKTVKLIKEDI